tara:strand:- start:298 stop:579 length:282 start_codon:yes stop_codon:yes gene_type:complete
VKYYNKDDMFLITGHQLNQCIWGIEMMMELFQENDDMIIKLGRLREELIKKMSYMELLDSIGLPQAPPENEIGWVDFLSDLGLKPSEKKGGKK